MKGTAVLLPLAVACTLAAAQSTPATAPPASGAPFICGGVGKADQDRMKSMAADHDLLLTFAVSTGAYAADVDVQVRDAHGAVVVSGRCEGPMMLVDLPASGRFHVTAQYNGQSREKTIAATRGKHSQATFVWPAQGNS